MTHSVDFEVDASQRHIAVEAAMPEVRFDLNAVASRIVQLSMVLTVTRIRPDAEIRFRVVFFRKKWMPTSPWRCRTMPLRSMAAVGGLGYAA